MSGVIPRPTVLGPALGTLDTSGLWRVRALDPSLASVARTVEGRPVTLYVRLVSANALSPPTRSAPVVSARPR